MKNNNKNKSLYLVALLAVALLVGVGYAVLTATLTINGQTKINKTTWDVHFENISTNDSGAIKFYAPSDTSMSIPISTISGLNATTLNYSVTLTGPDSETTTTHDMSVDIVNNGTLDAEITSVTLPTAGTLTGADPAGAAAPIAQMLTINCTYSDGTEITTGGTIKAGEHKTITCKHHYKTASELTTGDLTGWGSVPQSQVSANLSLALNFIAR